MKRNLTALALAMCMLLTGCAANSSSEVPSDAAQSAVTFTDDLGRTVTLPPPEKAAALLGSFAQVWMLAGGTVCAAPEEAWKDLELELAEDTANLGQINQMNMELLITTQPDFILASSNNKNQLEWKDTLEATGIPMAYFDIADFDDYLRLLRLCTDLTGQPERYEQYGASVQQEIDEVLAQSRQRLEQEEAPVVLSLTASASTVRAKKSEGNVLGEMLRSLGCVNLADTEESLLEDLSIEYILQEDPDYIFIVQRGDNTQAVKDHVAQMMAGHPAWSQLTAVQNGRLYFMDKNLYNLKPNHRWGEAYRGLEDILSHG